MKYTEFSGKTVEEAVEKGLKALSLTEEEADIRVLEEGKKKLFGAVKARVEIAAKSDVETEENEETEKPVVAQANAGGETDGERAVAFLEGLFKELKITACVELVSEGEKVEINVTAANGTAVIGKHGAMLDAIQTLASAVANTGREEYLRVVVDCENYREKRENTLNKLAENLAQKATRLQRKIQLEPMNPYERRIIHSALSSYEGIKTVSEGKEPNRYIVIIPENLEDETLPALPARSERRGNERGGHGYDRRGGNNRGRNDRNRGGHSGHGGNRGGYKKSGGSGATGGTTLKMNNDFFGIFLGNSGNSGEDNE